MISFEMSLKKMFTVRRFSLQSALFLNTLIAMRILLKASFVIVLREEGAMRVHQVVVSRLKRCHEFIERVKCALQFARQLLMTVDEQLKRVSSLCDKVIGDVAIHDESDNGD